MATKIEDVILFQIDLTSKLSKLHSQRILDQLNFGITVEQWVILKIVSEYSPLSQKELATKSYRDPASITRTLDLLEKKELLKRESTPNNRRMYTLSLTKKGEKFIEKHIDTISSLRKNSTKGITKKELTTLSDILSRMRKNMT